MFPPKDVTRLPKSYDTLRFSNQLVDLCILQHVPMLICPAVAVNKELKIDVKPLFLHTQNMTKVIDPQFASQKPKKIFARLISYVQREGQVRKQLLSRKVVGYLCLSMHVLEADLR